MNLFKGNAVALVTPTTQNDINYQETDKLINRVVSGGVSAIIALGSTGEAATLSETQKEHFVLHVRRKCNLPLIVGASSNNPHTVIKNCDTAKRLGADGVLIATPFYNKCTQDGAYEFFKYIAANISVPFIVYNVPSRTGFNLLPETALRILRLNGADGYKEASGNLSQIEKCIRYGLNVYSGDDGLTAPTCMYGGSGVISVASNIVPSLMTKITSSFFAGDFREGARVQLDLLPLIQTLFCEVNPIPVRAALQLVGIDCGVPRLPITKASATTVEKLKLQLKELQVI